MFRVLKAFLLYLVCRLVLVPWPDLMFLICRIKAFFPGFLFSLAMFLCLFTASFLVGAVSSVTSSLSMSGLSLMQVQASVWVTRKITFKFSFFSGELLYSFFTVHFLNFFNRFHVSARLRLTLLFWVKNYSKFLPFGAFKWIT